MVIDKKDANGVSHYVCSNLLTGANSTMKHALQGDIGSASHPKGASERPCKIEAETRVLGTRLKGTEQFHSVRNASAIVGDFYDPPRAFTLGNNGQTSIVCPSPKEP
jgi:hypothetical protein